MVMPKGLNYEVFISHNLQDQDWINQELLPRLEKRNVSCFYRQYPVAGKVVDEIVDGIATSRCYLFVISDGYLINPPDELEKILNTIQMFAARKIIFLQRNEGPILSTDSSVLNLKVYIRKENTIKFRGYETMHEQQKDGLWDEVIKAISDNDPRDDSYTVQVKALSDAHSVEDLLGFGVYVEALALFLENKDTLKPITIGIDAPWGGGKTTLMHMLKERLSPQVLPQRHWWEPRQTENFFTVWFNAWKYDDEESLWGALVLEILKQIKEQVPWHRRAKIWFHLNFNKTRFNWLGFFIDCAKAGGILIVCLFLLGFGLKVLPGLLGTPLEGIIEIGVKNYLAIFAGFEVLSIIAAIVGSVFGIMIKQAVSPFSLGMAKYIETPDYKSKLGFLGRFEKDFELVIEAVSEKGKFPLAIFIDDLDRCAPAKSASVIEAINLFLDSEYCVFIIGMDAKILSLSIQSKYKELNQLFQDAGKNFDANLGRHFLEKIIQINFRIPMPGKDHVKEFVETHLNVIKRAENKPENKQEIPVSTVESLLQAELRGISTSEPEAFKKARKAIKQRYPIIDDNDLEKAEKNINQRQSISFDKSESVQTTVSFIPEYFKSNPRQIKRFLNIYRLNAHIAWKRNLIKSTNGVYLESLGYWILITMCWSDFFEQVVINPGFAEEFYTQAQNASQILDKDTIQKKEFFDSLPSEMLTPKIKPFFADKGLINVLLKISKVSSLKSQVVESYLQIVQIASIRE